MFILSMRATSFGLLYHHQALFFLQKYTEFCKKKGPDDGTVNRNRQNKHYLLCSDRTVKFVIVVEAQRDVLC